jgi:hypothetical protein
MVGFGSPLLIYPALLALMLAVGGFTAAERDPGAAKGVEGRLRIRDERVEAEGETAFPTTSIACEDVIDGWIEPHLADEGHTLVLVARGGLQLRVSRDVRLPGGHSPRKLERALATLGLGERAIRMALVADPRGTRGCLGVFMGMILVAGFLSLAFVLIGLLTGNPAAIAVTPFALILTAPVVAMPHFLVPHRVLVGRDGVLVKRLFRLTRFVSYEQFEAVSESPASLTLQLRDGAALHIRASSAASAAAARIIRARLRSYQHGERNEIVTALQRGERSLEAWKQTLGNLLDAGRAHYRDAAIRADDLLSVVADPAAEPEQRVGAAYALRSDDVAIQKRLRIAVEGCAQPAVRAAIERAVEGELEEEMLAEAERAVTRARTA